MKNIKNHIYLLIGILFWSCSKSGVELSDHIEKKLVVEGSISKLNEIQEFVVSWTNNIGEDEADYFDGIELSINTPTGIVNFISKGEGVYQSEIPFTGIPELYYTINFSYDGINHTALTKMPSQMSLGGIYLTPEYELTTVLYAPNIHLIVSSDQNQFFRYELYTLVKDSLPDTVWLHQNTPVYWVQPVKAESNQDIILYRSSPYYFGFSSFDVVKFKIFTYSTDAGEYLQDLFDYMSTEFSGSQYRNPPYYYSNQAYGLGCGTIVDSLYYYFQE